MPPRIWIILKTQGLKSNLLQLALASGNWELRFSEKAPRGADEWQGLTHLIVDDAGVKNPRKIFRELKPGPGFQRLIYLSQSPAGFKTESFPLPMTCLTKPFDPRELRDMIAKDVQTHESKA